MTFIRPGCPGVHRHFLIVVGEWKFENWHLYRQRQHHAVKDPKIRWYAWDLVL